MRLGTISFAIGCEGENNALNARTDVFIKPPRFVIVNVGGFLGIGGTRVAVPWTALQIAKEGDKPNFVTDASKDFLEKAPRVDDKKYDSFYARESAEPVFTYWHVIWLP